jgi:hypothetical protein
MKLVTETECVGKIFQARIGVGSEDFGYLFQLGIYLILMDGLSGLGFELGAERAGRHSGFHGKLC